MSPTRSAELARWLATDPGRAAIRAAQSAASAHATDPLGAATALRSAQPGLSPAESSAVLEQAELRRRARDRYALPADDLLLTRDGLQQASRPQVAAYRAGLLRESGARRVLDLTAGLGFDAGAFLAAGLAVTAVEQDPRTAVLCRHNLPGATVIEADATAPGVLADLLGELTPTDVVFVDPARRDPGAARDLATGRARPERDPERWSPPWSFIESIPHPRVAIKAAPAFAPPPGWHATWSSVDRVVVENGSYSWAVFDARRRAVVHAPSGLVVVDATDGQLPLATDLGGWLLEPDPALERAGALAALHELLSPGVRRIDDESSWLTCDIEPALTSRPWARAYRVVSELTGSTADQRRTLRARSIDRLVVKSRDVRIDPQRALRDLGCKEGNGPVLILTRRAGRTVSLLVDAVPERHG